jgi:prepilin-type N-terminal cleavage/methylation domain-containing protein
MKHKQHQKHAMAGFTIVELLVVISIIALLVGILVPAVQKARDSAKTTQSKSNSHQVMIALANFATDHNDRNFSTAPDDLSSGARKGMFITDAIADAEGPDPMGIELGEHEAGGQAYVYYIAMFGNGGDESGGIAPYCFASGKTTSSTGKAGYGVWRYPNAGQVAGYMGGMPLHSAYFAPKDVVPLRALEGCSEIPASYCPSSGMQEGHSALSPDDVMWNSNMLQAPSSYCISPSMMYSPAVYQWDPRPVTEGHPALLPTDPMDLPRGFKPPSTDQAKYPGHKTWLMEHNWLQNVDNNECGVNWEFGGWFLDGDGTWDGCEPEHFNGSRHSEPVTVMADGSTTIFNVADAAGDDERVAGQDWWNNQGLWIKDMFDGVNGYYVDYRTDWVEWSGHTHTKDGIRGRDRLNAQ